MTANPLPAPPPASTPTTTTPFAEDPVPGARRRRALAAGAVAAVALLVGVAAFAGVSAASSGAAGYRTATVSTQDVERTLAAVGTIEPVAQAAVAFPVSGTVATVDVTTGSTVEAGQVLATLDGTELQRAVNTQLAAVDQANLNLQKVLNGESVSTGASTGASGGSGSTTSRTSGSGTSSASTSSASTGSSGSSGSSSGNSSSAADQAALTAARKAVADTQHTLDVDIAAAESALATSTTACATDPSTTTTTGTESSTTSTTEPTATGSAACQQALAASLTAQQTVAADAKALQDAVNTLDRLLSTSSGSGSSTSGSGGSTSSSTGSSGSSGSGSGSSVSSADIVAAQKAVDAADAQLAVAQQALAQATIVSPIAGTVTAVRLTVGESVSAGSSTATILVAGPGGYEVATSIAVTDLPHVAVGQSATVVPDGSTDVLPAKVVQIGLVASSSTSGTTTTYPVVLALTDPTTNLPDGGLASIHIVTGATAGVTAVPTSAVTTTATGRTVVVLDGGKPKTVAVQVGTVGGTWTEITGGVEVGQTVVLADLSLALPGSATSGSSTSSTGSARSTTGSGATGGTGGFTPPAGFTPPGR